MLIKNHPTYSLEYVTLYYNNESKKEPNKLQVLLQFQIFSPPHNRE